MQAGSVASTSSGGQARGSHETTGLRRLYICLTRAVSSLVVLAAAPLPEALGEAA